MNLNVDGYLLDEHGDDFREDFQGKQKVLILAHIDFELSTVWKHTKRSSYYVRALLRLKLPPLRARSPRLSLPCYVSQNVTLCRV